MTPVLLPMGGGVMKHKLKRCEVVSLWETQVSSMIACTMCKGVCGVVPLLAGHGAHFSYSSGCSGVAAIAEAEGDALGKAASLLKPWGGDSEGKVSHGPSKSSTNGLAVDATRPPLPSHGWSGGSLMSPASSPQGILTACLGSGLVKGATATTVN